MTKQETMDRINTLTTETRETLNEMPTIDYLKSVVNALDKKIQHGYKQHDNHVEVFEDTKKQQEEEF